MCGIAFIPCKCDVTDESQIDQAVKMAEETFGQLDALVLNAGAVITIDGGWYTTHPRVL